MRRKSELQMDELVKMNLYQKLICEPEEITNESYEIDIVL